jgi:sec-independent protein translocase protein TatA
MGARASALREGLTPPLREGQKGVGSLTRVGAERRVRTPHERSIVMFGLGYQELLIILVIVLILFGANRLPELARSLGSSVKEFKKGVVEIKDDTSSASKKDEEKKA